MRYNLFSPKRKTRLFFFFSFLGFFLLFPGAVSADNCSTFLDCFNTAKAAAAAAAAAGILAAIASAAADLTPGVGEIKAGTQLITGKDPITNEDVPRWQSAIGLIPVFGRVAARGLRYGMAAARAGQAVRTSRALRTGARGLGKGIDIYETVRDPYDKVTTVRDAAKNVAGQLNDLMGQSKTGYQSGSSYAGTTARDAVGASHSGPKTYVARAIPLDQFLQVLYKNFDAINADAPAEIAKDTLKDLAKTFGKDSQVLKSLIKTKGLLDKLPKNATMKDVVDNLKEYNG